MNSNEQSNQKRERMLHGSIPKLILSLAVPAIVAMVITNIYNTADSFFLGRVSTAASAAVGVSFSYMALIQAFAFFFGQGSGTFISKALGKGKVEEAKQMASLGFFASLIFGLVFMIVGLAAMDPLLRLMGATDTSIGPARGYFAFICIAAPFIMGSIVLNNQMRFQGNALFSMIGIGLGGILNIAIDPLFIFVFDMGAMGAGLATCLSQIVSFILLLFLSRRKGNISISFKSFKVSKDLLCQMWKGGVPSLFRQGLMSVAGICLNQACAMAMAGSSSEDVDSAIAAFAAVTRLLNLASSIGIGIGQGFQPVCGFNYGAKEYKRVKQAFFFSLGIATGYAAIMAVIGMIFPRELVAFIRSEDPLLLEIGAKALRQEAYVFVLLGGTVIPNMYLQTIGKSFPASLTAMARSGLFYIPLLFLFGSSWGIAGLQWAQPIAEALSFLLSFPLGLFFLFRMGNKKRSGAISRMRSPYNP